MIATLATLLSLAAAGEGKIYTDRASFSAAMVEQYAEDFHGLPVSPRGLIEFDETLLDSSTSYQGSTGLVAKGAKYHSQGVFIFIGNDSTYPLKSISAYGKPDLTVLLENTVTAIGLDLIAQGGESLEVSVEAYGDDAWPVLNTHAKSGSNSYLFRGFTSMRPIRKIVIKQLGYFGGGTGARIGNVSVGLAKPSLNSGG